MLSAVRSSRFKRDVRRAKARSKDLRKLRLLLEALIEEEPLSTRDPLGSVQGVATVRKRVPLGRCYPMKNPLRCETPSTFLHRAQK